MDKHKHKNEWFVTFESNIKDSDDSSRISQFIRRTHTLRIFYLLAGIFQMVLGLAVVTVAILGLITPFWLSASLVMVGSVAAMIGFYLVYITITKSHNKKSLLRNAIKRVMEFRN